MDSFLCAHNSQQSSYYKLEKENKEDYYYGYHLWDRLFNCIY